MKRGALLALRLRLWLALCVLATALPLAAFAQPAAPEPAAPATSAEATASGGGLPEWVDHRSVGRSSSVPEHDGRHPADAAAQRNRGGGPGRAGVPSVGTSLGRSTTCPRSGVGST